MRMRRQIHDRLQVKMPPFSASKPFQSDAPMWAMMTGRMDPEVTWYIRGGMM